jgi:hypothetical protein
MSPVLTGLCQCVKTVYNTSNLLHEVQGMVFWYNNMVTIYGLDNSWSIAGQVLRESD